MVAKPLRTGDGESPKQAISTVRFGDRPEGFDPHPAPAIDQMVGKSILFLLLSGPL